MMPSAAETPQIHAIGIGDFDLSFIVRVWWCSGEPGGWMWSAQAEDDMTGVIRGRHPMTSAASALEAATLVLTRMFN